MTTDELRDWHARRRYVADMPGLSQQSRDGWDAAYFRRLDDNEMHPFPPTIDGAASALLKGWRLVEMSDNQTEYGTPKYPWTATARKEFGGRMPESVKASGHDEIECRYLLAKLAWEQEQALAAACKEVGNGN
jgi:hypothetical protein